MPSLNDMIQELPSYAQTQVQDFVTFLHKKHVQKSARQLRQDWAGGLNQYRHQYTALELQKKALEWRNT